MILACPLFDVARHEIGGRGLKLNRQVCEPGIADVARHEIGGRGLKPEQLGQGLNLAAVARHEIGGRGLKPRLRPVGIAGLGRPP